MLAQGRTGPLANSWNEGYGDSAGEAYVRAVDAGGTVAMQSRNGTPASRAMCCSMRLMAPPAETPPTETESALVFSWPAFSRTYRALSVSFPP